MLLLGLTACRKTDGNLSKIPEISSLQQSARHIRIAPDSEDTLLFQFRFKDGDADINGGKAKVVFKDILDTAAVEVDYPFPEINALLDPGKGITGTALISLDANAILFQIADTSKTSEMKLYDIYMTDDAGNKSNVLRSDSVRVEN